MDDNQQLGPKILTTSDISGALDSAFAVGMSSHLCPFCTRGYVYHRFRDWPVLADTIWSGYAYQNGRIDPKWNPDNQQVQDHSSPGQSSSKAVAKPVSKPSRGNGHGGRGGYRAGYSGGCGQSFAMASVQRNATPPKYVPKLQVHTPLSRMLPPDNRRGSNDVRSGVKSFYETLDMEEHGHALVAIAVVERGTRKQVEREEREICGSASIH